jgi:hypothetical protein
MLRNLPWVIVFLILSAAPSTAGRIVDPGGTILGIAADPVRPLFYASLDTCEVVVIQIESGSILARIATPQVPGQMAVEPDGSKLYVALVDTYDIGVIDPGLRIFSGIIDLSASGYPPKSLVPGRPGRLYVTCEGLSIVDTAAGTEIYFGTPRNAGTFSNSDLAVTPDGSTLFVLDRKDSGTFFALDVTTDSPAWLGAADAHEFADQIGVSPDCRVCIACGGANTLPTHALTAMFYSNETVSPGYGPNSIAFSPGRDMVYAGSSHRDEFAVASLSTLLPWHVEALAGRPADHGLALSGDGAAVGVMLTTGGSDPDRIEIVDVRWLAANRGGIRLRPLDDTSGLPVASAYIMDPLQEGESAFIEMENGVLARAPVHPGTYEMVLSASGYETTTREVTVAAGRWSDLGDIVMRRTGSPPGPARLIVTPALLPGITRNVQVRGIGFQQGATVTSTSPSFTINSYTFRNWSRIDATITAAPGIAAGVRQEVIRVANPDGQEAFSDLVVLDRDPVPGSHPPNRIHPLYAVKRPPSDVQLLWGDSRVDGCHDSAEYYVGYRSTTAPDSGYGEFANFRNTPASVESLLDGGALEPVSPFSAHHFYRVSARNAAGDSGDIPPQ